MDYPSAPGEAPWIASGGEPLHPIAPGLAMPHGRPSRARSRRLPAGQSSMNRSRSATGPVSFQGISEALPIRPHGCAAHQLGSYRCRKRGLPAARSVSHPRVAVSSPCQAGGTLPSRCRGAGAALHTPGGGDLLECPPRIRTALPIPPALALTSQSSLKSLSAYSERR